MIEAAVNTFFIAVIASILIVFFSLVCVKYTMHKTSKEFERDRIFPSGAGIRHGLVRSNDGSGEVILDSKPSLTWYKRLVR